jgi:putative acetyltransferase
VEPPLPFLGPAKGGTLPVRPKRAVQEVHVATRTVVREERDGDGPAVRRVLELAFGRESEADLVDTLREGCGERFSLVAERDGEVVGHALFTPVEIGHGAGRVDGMGLAPVAVLPKLQCLGLGSAIVREGIDRLRANGCACIVVIGSPEYYRRFGFVPASRYGVRCEWDIPDESFMLLLLDEAVEERLKGGVTFRQEFH